jgi:phosphoglycolate phosphatase-like HAD superfamily hydrolase
MSIGAYARELEGTSGFRRQADPNLLTRFASKQVIVGPMSLPRPIRAVVFDMDGTLFNSTAAVYNAYADALASVSGPALTPAEVVGLYPLGPPERILSHVLGVSGVELEDLVRTYHRFITAHGANLRAYDGIPELLEALHSAGVATAVFTGADQVSCDVLVSAAGMRQRFSSLLGTDVAGAAKPAPDGLLLTCERLGVVPQETAYVGDGPLDQRCARAAGAVAVSAGWGHLFDAAEPADLQALLPTDVLTGLGISAIA